MATLLIKKFVSVGLICIFIFGFSLLSFSSQEQSPIQALLITGGGWHDYDEQERLLTEGVNKRLGDQIEWTIVHEGDGEPDYHVSIFKRRKLG